MNDATGNAGNNSAGFIVRPFVFGASPDTGIPTTISAATIGGLSSGSVVSGFGGVALVNTALVAVDLSVGSNNTNQSFSGVISGAGSMTKIGAGTQTLAGVNTYTGVTTVSNGTLEAAGASALGGTTNITVNTGGTLLLSNTGTTDRINNAATMTLAGGIVAISGNVTEGSSRGIGALTLSASSVIDFANGDGTLKWDDSHAVSWTGLLSIYNYTPGADHLFFGIVDHDFNGTDGGLMTAQLSQVSFFSGINTGFLGSTSFLSGGAGEIAPVPEPSSVAIVLGLLGLVGWREGRKTRRPQRISVPAEHEPVA